MDRIPEFIFEGMKDKHETNHISYEDYKIIKTDVMSFYSQ